MLTAGVAACLQAHASCPPAPRRRRPAAAPSRSYVPERVFDTRSRTFTDFEAMLADLARADVVFVGEQHDDPNTHRLESALLAGLLRRPSPVTVSLEMFERDVQPALDAYLGGTITEEDFLKASRPVAALRDRLPAARGVRQGSLVAGDRRQRAAPLSRPRSRRPALAPLVGAAGGRTRADRRPISSARRTPTSIASPRRWASILAARAGDRDRDQQATIDRYYQSQCVKDETMAESIAGVVRSGTRAAAGRSSTSPARSTATSAPAPRNACAAGCPAAASSARHDPAGRKPRQPHAGRRRSQAGRLSRLHDQMSWPPARRLTAQSLSHLRDHVGHHGDRRGARDMSIGSILSIVSAGVWWIRK